MKAVNGTGLKRVAVISDLSCFGKASITVTHPILSAWGVEAVPLPTAILSTHTGEFEGFQIFDMTEEMRKIIAHWKELGLHFDCIYTGYLGSLDQIDIVEDFVRSFASEDTLVLVDPIMGDQEKLYAGFSQPFVESMGRLCDLADIITPNHTEACFLTGLPLDTPDEQLLEALPQTNVIITSIRAGEGRTGYLARLGGELTRIETELLDVPLHGAGDVFASAFCARLVSGMEPVAALREAADFCQSCIRETVKLHPWHWYGLAFEKLLPGTSL